jgi:hypothetical protein
MQDLGLPALMSHGDIVREIARTPGSRGIVFLQDARKGGHVVNVWNENGDAYFYDAQSGIEASYLVEQAKTVWLYRTK